MGGNELGCRSCSVNSFMPGPFYFSINRLKFHQCIDGQLNYANFTKPATVWAFVHSINLQSLICIWNTHQIPTDFITINDSSEVVFDLCCVSSNAACPVKVHLPLKQVKCSLFCQTLWLNRKFPSTWALMANYYVNHSMPFLNPD